MLLFIAAIILFFWGRKVMFEQIHKENHGNWPTHIVLRGFRHWDQDRAAMVLGAVALQAAAIIIVFSLITSMLG